MIKQTLLEKVLKKAVETEKPIKRFRYLFYDAPPEFGIKFTHLTTILKSNSPEKDVLIEKLKGGNTGKYCADYFRWKKIYIVTNQYTDDNIVYTAELNNIGTKIVGTEKIYPLEAASKINISDLENDLMLYNTKKGNSNVINIDVGESFFTDKEEPKSFIKILLNGLEPSGFVGYNDFIKIFDEYRVWIPSLNVLLLPDLEVPKTDDVKGGHYKGGQKAFEDLIGPYLKNIEETKEKKELSLGEKIFTPVDEQKKDKVKGDYLDNKTASMVNNVILNYLKDAGMMLNPIDKKDNLSKKLLEDAKKHELIKKKLEDTAKTISEIGY